MAFLKREQIAPVVFRSIENIANLPANPETAPLTGLDNFQKHVFLSTLKSNLNSLPYYMNDGSTNHLAYYDVKLTPDSIDDWPTVGDCIDWILGNQRVVYL